MQIILSPPKLKSDIIILPLFKDGKTKNFKIPATAQTDFKNSLGTTHLVYSENASGRILLLGLGEKNKFKLADWRIALHSAMQACRSLDVTTGTLILPEIAAKTQEQTMELIGFGLVFSSYEFDAYKKDFQKLKLKQIFVVGKKSAKLIKALERGTIIGTAANEARNLANHPGNVATPSHLAQHAEKLAKQFKFQCKILDAKAITKEGLGLVMGVSAGSEQPPKFIILEYGIKSQPPIILIGKGLTFDSGGVSIKPADRMEEMKYDMSGGATVLGIFEAAAKLKLPVHLVGLIPAAENLVSGQALKPGDILKAHDDTTVEIINTDAEGRLVLADAISFAKKYYKPQVIIDYATLTGAMIVALGDQVTGYFSNTKVYDKLFNESARITAEPLWSMPLTAEYREQLKSMFADIKNIGEKGTAGATTAALFLEHFVGTTPWIHMDIAGTAWTMRPKNYAAAGATAWGVYLTVNFLRNL